MRAFLHERRGARSAKRDLGDLSKLFRLPLFIEGPMTEHQISLLQLLKLRRDRVWRRGLLQGAASFGVINQRQWEFLERQIADRVAEPVLEMPESGINLLSRAIFIPCKG